MNGVTINQVKVGDSAEFSKTISETDVYNFAGVTGDMNPMHVNEEYAKNTFFGGRIAHGILSVGLLSNVMGNQIPGPGSVYISQFCSFKRPVRIGDTITARVEVTDVNVEKNRLTLRTYCVNQKGEIVLDGEAITSPKKE
jgi:3-hydroxybutyryl-CoA dehydratase